MVEVPEGQVPRDEAFWRTYHAVNAEMEECLVRYRCSRDGHSILMTSDWSGCEKCRMTLDEIARTTGAIQQGNQWAWEAPCP